jgi:hypoxanthine phosphoribosyltransferase
MHQAFEILIDEHAIDRRIGELAATLNDWRDGDAPWVPVAVLEGARRFATALCARLPGAAELETVRVSSYGAGTTSNGAVQLVQDVAGDLHGARVLLIEDIVDTGRTVEFLREHLTARGARSVAVATLLSKPSRRVVEVALDHVGFEIPDRFVIGYGMDLDGKYRELPHVAIYSEEVAGSER